MRTRRSPRNQDRLYKAIGRDLARAAEQSREAPEEQLYDAVVRLGIPHDSHASDLYLPDTEAVRALLTEHAIVLYSPSCRQFRNQVDHALWWDLPFKYLPWWRARVARATR